MSVSPAVESTITQKTIQKEGRMCMPLANTNKSFTKHYPLLPSPTPPPPPTKNNHSNPRFKKNNPPTPPSSPPPHPLSPSRITPLKFLSSNETPAYITKNLKTLPKNNLTKNTTPTPPKPIPKNPHPTTKKKTKKKQRGGGGGGLGGSRHLTRPFVARTVPPVLLCPQDQRPNVPIFDGFK